MTPLKATGDRTVPELLKALLHSLPAASHNDAASEPADTILLDMELEGSRYLLIHMCPVDPQGQVTLSPREQEIARMVAKGYPNKAIAGVLNISTWTVCTHVRRVFAKLNVTSRAAMVAKLLKEESITRLTEPPATRARAANIG